MSRTYAYILPLVLSSVISVSLGVPSTGIFDEDFYVTWAPDHVTRLNRGHGVQINLDRHSGSGFASKKTYLFGKFETQIKLPPGNSAGTVVAYYLYSNQPNRDEIDIEFLGNVDGRKYIMQTNIYSNGLDDREQRIKLWFDPTADFHTYTVLWNRFHIIFLVDGITIRAHANNAIRGIPFPRKQPMSVYASIWNGENWATNGGKTKISWRQAPFASQFRNFKIDACEWNGNPRFCKGASAANWWNKRNYAVLGSSDRLKLNWVKKNYLTYDYCSDRTRFKVPPRECRHQV
eukprot:Gb_31995 [translate_table: standard]